MKFTTLPLVVLLTALAAAGCSRAQARVVPNLPPLDVPAPPPRVVEVQDPATLAPGTLVGEPARNTPPPRPAAPRPDPARADAVKPEPPPSTEPAVVTPEEPTRAPGAPTLQTTSPGTAQDVERTVKAQIDQARTTLTTRVDFQRLNPGARTQYNQALQFIATAETALKERNLEFARVQAEKAATLASQLSGR